MIPFILPFLAVINGLLGLAISHQFFELRVLRVRLSFESLAFEALASARPRWDEPSRSWSPISTIYSIEMQQWFETLLWRTFEADTDLVQHETLLRRTYILLLRHLQRCLKEQWPARSKPSFWHHPSAVSRQDRTGTVALRGGNLSELDMTLEWLANCAAEQAQLVRKSRLRPNPLLYWDCAAFAHDGFGFDEGTNGWVRLEVYPQRIDTEIERLSAGLESARRIDDRRART